MKIILLGTGTPIVDPERQGPSTLLEINNEYFLFDCGRGVTTQLIKAKIPLQDIGLLFITHHHIDHISDLGDLLLAIWNSGRKTKIQIIGPTGTSTIIKALLESVLVRDIQFNIALEKSFNNSIPDIKDLIIVNDVKPGIVYSKDDVKIFTRFVEHGQLFLGFTQNNWPSLGYRIETNKNVIAISGDSIVCDELSKLVNKADVFVQCCFLSEEEIDSHSRKILTTHIIASADSIGQFANQKKIPTLILTHFRKKSSEQMKNIELKIKRNFFGNLVLGKDLQVIEL